MAKEIHESMTVYFLIPVYNEELNIPSLYEELSRSIGSYNKKYVLVDDGSSDNSGEMIQKLFPKETSTLIQYTPNKGPGYAFNKGFEWILKESDYKNDIIITMEGDNTSALESLDKMIENLQNGYDMVLASVYFKEGKFDNTPFLRKVSSIIANNLLKKVYHIDLKTISSFYRAYRVELIKNVKDKHKEIIKEPGFISMAELLIKCKRLNAKISEVPVTLYSNRRKGDSKMKIIKTTVDYIKFMLKKEL